MAKSRLRLLILFVGLLGVSVLMSGCGYFDSPQNIFAPRGQVAQDQKDLFFLTMWPALGVLVLVEGLLLFIMVKFRRKKGDAGLPAQTHGNNALEIGWTVAPMILLAFFVVPTIAGIVDLGRTPKNSMEVDVTGVQWQWLFAYPDPAGGPPIPAPIGELHIPINKTIAIKLHSNDVIHSWWVPKLAGKTDVIPGRNNHMWIKGTDLGVYSGQCAEFCGLNHGTMRFTVTVESQEDFDAWLAEQKASASARPAPAGEPVLALHGE